MCIKKNSRDLFLFRGLTVIAQMLSGIILARLLGPESRGVFALLVLVPTLCGQIGSFGFNFTNAFFIEHPNFYLKNIAGYTLYLQLIIVVVIAGIFYILSPLLAKMMGVYNNLFELKFLILAIPLMLIMQNGAGSLLGQKRFRAIGLIQFMRPFAFLTGMLFLNLFGLISISYFIAVFMFSFLLPAILLFFISPNSFNIAQPSKGNIYKIIRFSFPIWIAHVSGFLFYRIDLFILSLWWDHETCGIYAVSFFIAEGMGLFGSTLGEVIFPYIIATFGNKNSQFLSKALRYSLSITTVLALLVGMSAPYLVNMFFGESFLPAVPIILLTLPGIVARNGLKVLSSWHIANANVKLNAFVNGFGALLVLILNLLFIPSWGMVGAATVTSFVFILLFFLSLAAAKSSKSPSLLTNLS